MPPHGSQRDPCQDQGTTRQCLPGNRFTQHHPTQDRHDQEGQSHERVGDMQRGMAQHPDPYQRSNAIQRQGGNEPAVEDPLLPACSVGNGLRSFLEKQLPKRNAEDAEDGDTGEQRIHGVG